ncbi:hypothetical protein [Brevibacterium aurantiacum]|nr:hypothetical protein [Brevibacterium aurantiacum]MDN5549799.1 hypothetical protein [Brevibacterium sp.]MDN5712096.1 hypothetical protein [Brevibacterium aurantiacum]MDN5735053.1 hypothetical protein [Brevibacterium aurantiacum]MDN5737255.1 hypothetical protein [Brevibacterium aurantiacum]MDN5791715.1 hypothetical protein [Brevibacterium aurantiacum]
MSRPLNTAAALHAMDRGRSVVVGTSSRKLIVILCLALVIGAVLVGLSVLIVSGSVERNVSWVLFAFNPRMWAFAIGIVGCLVVAPIAVGYRLRRADALVVSNAGLVESHRGAVLPASFVSWNEIERITLDTVTPRPGPKYVIYYLTRDSVQRRGRTGLFARRITLRNGFEFSHRQLFELLTAAHARYARQIR